MRNCLNCGKQYEEHYRRQRYCSVECRWRKNSLNYRTKNHELVIAKKRKSRNFIPSMFSFCPICNIAFITTDSSHRKYCSPKCSAQAKRKSWADRASNNFLIARRLRRRIKQAFDHYSKTGKIYHSKDYGIDFQAIIHHLKPFPENIDKYHIDHIKPLCAFDLTNSEEIKQAFAPENHQWLTKEENLQKGIKIQ